MTIFGPDAVNTILNSLILLGVVGLIAFHVKTEHRLTKIETTLEIYTMFIRKYIKQNPSSIED